MTSLPFGGPLRAWVRLALSPWRASWRTFRMFLVALAAALGAPPPTLARHEDSVVQVADEDAPSRDVRLDKTALHV